MESAAYMENNTNDMDENIQNSLASHQEVIEEYTPKLFSEDQGFQEGTAEVDEPIENESEELFDQDINEDDDFEIPAFLRKQKF